MVCIVQTLSTMVLNWWCVAFQRGRTGIMESWSRQTSASVFRSRRP